MNIQQALQWGIAELKDLENPSLESEVLLSSVLQCDRAFLKAHSDKEIPFWKWLLNKKFVQERKQRIPVAYILGHKDWGEMRLVVNNNVLIPRDETEVLCHHILQKKRSFSPQSILDVGTGSGSIGLFLARNFLSADITGLDISHKALKVARRNAILNHVKNIRLLHSNLLGALSHGESFDIIVANLPYLPQKLEISPEVSREPKEALFSGKDGLDSLRIFADQVQEKDIQFQELWLEFLPSQKEAIQEIFAHQKYQFFTDSGQDVFFVCVS